MLKPGLCHTNNHHIRLSSRAKNGTTHGVF